MCVLSLASVIVVLSVLSTIAPVASASGTCQFCSYSPFTHPITTSVPLAVNCGSNVDHVGPTFASGTTAEAYPETTACTGTLANDYTQTSTSGVNHLSDNTIAGAVTAKFWWNATWSSLLTTPACTPPSAPHVAATLIFNASVYDRTTATYYTASVTVFAIAVNACSGSTSHIQTTSAHEYLTISFTATGGDNYQFDSRVSAQTHAACNGCTPAGLTLDAKLNIGQGYGGVITAIQVA